MNWFWKPKLEVNVNYISPQQRLADHIDSVVDRYMDSLTEEQRLAGVTRVAVLGAIVQRPTCQSCAFFLAPGRCMHDLGGFRQCSHDDWCHNHPFMQIYIEILTLDPWALKTAMVRFDQPAK